MTHPAFGSLPFGNPFGPGCPPFAGQAAPWGAAWSPAFGTPSFGTFPFSASNPWFGGCNPFWSNAAAYATLFNGLSPHFGGFGGYHGPAQFNPFSQGNPFALSNPFAGASFPCAPAFNPQGSLFNTSWFSGAPGLGAQGFGTPGFGSTGPAGWNQASFGGNPAGNPTAGRYPTYAERSAQASREAA